MADGDMRPTVNRITNERVSGMGRRRFLQLLSGAGLTGVSAAWLTAEDVQGAGSDEVPIVEMFRHEDPTQPDQGVETEVKYVPADWYNELEHARRVRRSLQLERLDGVTEVDTRPGIYGGRSAKVRVGVSPEAAQGAGTTYDEVVSRIPAQKEGIEIEVEEVGMPELTSCYNSDFGDSVPGGAIVKNTDGGYGTLTGGVYDDGYGPRFITNQHIFNSVSNDNMYHDDTYEDPVGYIYDAYCNLDYVIGYEQYGHTASTEIAGTSLTIEYQYAKSGIDDLVAQEETAKKQGVRTCETSGTVVSSAGYIGLVDDGCSDRDWQVKGEWYIDNGDSGSPAYRDLGNGEAAILSMNAGRDPLNGNAFGFGAYHLYDEQNIYWS